MDAMVQVYYRLVKAGKRTIDQVPEHLREAVQAKLTEINTAE